MPASDIQQFLSQARYHPEFVTVTINLESGRQFLKLTFEWKGKLSNLSTFLCDVRIDLERNGLSVIQIGLGSTGVSFASIQPEIDPEGVAFPEFHVKPTEQFAREYSDFLAAATVLRQRAQEAQDE